MKTIKNVKVVQNLEIVLNLNFEQAKFLKEILQNPSYENESEVISDLRKEIFECLLENGV